MHTYLSQIGEINVDDENHHFGYKCSFTAHFLFNKINLDKGVFSLHGSNQFKQNLVPFVS
jgi:hypothetical protein